MEPLDSIVDAFIARDYRISRHHWDQVVSDARPVPSLVEEGIARDQPVIIEDYPPGERGKSCLILCEPPSGTPIHVVVGYEKRPMTVVTAYPPDPALWEPDNRTRRRHDAK